MVGLANAVIPGGSFGQVTRDAKIKLRSDQSLWILCTCASCKHLNTIDSKLVPPWDCPGPVLKPCKGSRNLSEIGLRLPHLVLSHTLDRFFEYFRQTLRSRGYLATWTLSRAYLFPSDFLVETV